jgi:hypothetical protein
VRAFESRIVRDLASTSRWHEHGFVQPGGESLRLPPCVVTGEDWMVLVVGELPRVLRGCPTAIERRA